MKIKFFSILSGKDKKYWDIKNNFQRHLQKIGLEKTHELIITDTHSGDFEEKGFIDTVYYKLDITRDYLKKGYHVLCSDLDIVFLKNPFPYLVSIIGNDDILFQNDFVALGGGKIYSVYCTGFYFAKPNRKTIQLFDTKIGIFNNNNKIDLEGTGDRSDQNYINKKLWQKRFRSLDIQMLEKDLFPNGWWWFNHNSSLNPYIIHYNCITGIEDKIQSMKKYNHWLG